MMIKKNFQKIRFGLPAVTAVVLACVMSIFSCKDQDVMFKQYTVEGGITYLGAVSGAKTRIGMNRLEVGFSVADPATSKVGIFWNNYEDSVMIDVEPGEQVRKIIDLPEGQYSLFIKSYDARGNASNPIELITSTVGENYLAMIGHRVIKKKMTTFNSDLSIEWDAASGNGAQFTDLFYTSTDGTEKRLRIENNTNETKIDDYKQGTVFRRITYYSPDNSWLDSITPATPGMESEMSVDKKLGKVVAYSTQTSGDEAAKFYDDDAFTVWQTNNRYPEYATIDLGIKVPVTSFVVIPAVKYTPRGRADPRAPTTVRFEVSTDNNTWTSLGDYSYDNGIPFYEHRYEVEQTNARYVRFTGVECTGAPLFSTGIGGPNTVKMILAELNVNISIEASASVVPE
jgi:hypothetical protein